MQPDHEMSLAEPITSISPMLRVGGGKLRGRREAPNRFGWVNSTGRCSPLMRPAVATSLA
ncbi:hypothetical protein AB0M45_03165 [Nocardia sp. NPDC051787]|uniref:hypothetical protein n=1 Tax=Nocardia sp. NPDC051787 TaxID=3155415 RepID=UPI00342D2A08